MFKSLISVMIVGATVGLILPSGRTDAPVAQAAGTRAPVPVETPVPRQRNGHFYVDATVNGQHVRFLVDTGRRWWR
jgi:predicted aspartyl protease